MTHGTMNVDEAQKKVEDAEKELQAAVTKEIQSKINEMFNDPVKKAKLDKVQGMLKDILEKKGISYSLETLDALLCGITFAKSLAERKEEDFEAFCVSVIIATVENMRDEQNSSTA